MYDVESITTHWPHHTLSPTVSVCFSTWLTYQHESLSFSTFNYKHHFFLCYFCWSSIFPSFIFISFNAFRFPFTMLLKILVFQLSFRLQFHFMFASFFFLFSFCLSFNTQRYTLKTWNPLDPRSSYERVRTRAHTHSHTYTNRRLLRFPSEMIFLYIEIFFYKWNFINFYAEKLTERKSGCRKRFCRISLF